MDNNLFDSMLELANETVNNAVNVPLLDDKYESANRVAINAMKQLTEIERLDEEEARNQRDYDLRKTESDAKAELEKSKHDKDVQFRKEELDIRKNESESKIKRENEELALKKDELNARIKKDESDVDIRSHELDLREEEEEHNYELKSKELELKDRELEYRHQEREWEHEEALRKAEVDEYVKKMETITKAAVLAASALITVGSAIIVPIVIEKNHTRKWEATMITEANDVIVNKNSLNVAKESPKVKATNLVSSIF